MGIALHGGERVSVYQHPSELDRALDALRKDLLSADGPQISTVRNYNFAILPYDPEHEFLVRQRIHDVSEALRDAGWNTATIPLHTLLLARLRGEGGDVVAGLIEREKRLVRANDPWRGLRSLKQHIVNLLDGHDGIAADVIREVHQILAEDGRNPARTVIFLGRTGALYPFLRTSALLKHIADHTKNAPVVLLYPGKVIGETGLSFMGIMPADRDYRPRIYR